MLLVDIIPKGPGQEYVVDLLRVDSHFLGQHTNARRHGSLSQLKFPYVLLGDDDILPVPLLARKQERIPACRRVPVFWL